jgi:hypothetical protein
VKAPTTRALEPQVGDLEWWKAAPQAYQALRSEFTSWNFLLTVSLVLALLEASNRSSLLASSPLAIKAEILTHP